MNWEFIAGWGAAFALLLPVIWGILEASGVHGSRSIGSLVVTSCAFLVSIVYFIRLEVPGSWGSQDFQGIGLVVVTGCAFLVSFGHSIRLICRQKMTSPSISLVRRKDWDQLQPQFERAELVRVFASSTETYLGMFKDYLPSAARSAPLKVRLLLRHNESDRGARLNEYRRKWADFETKHNIRCDIRVYEFKVMFRGLIFDASCAFLGAYWRDESGTQGQDYPMVRYPESDAVGKEMITQATMAFDTLWNADKTSP